MGEYIIGSGALLKAGEGASITAAALHAQVASGLASVADAIAVDFDGMSASRLRRLLLVASGWTAAAFEDTVTAHLLARGTCTLAQVMGALGCAVGTRTVHLFANWIPDEGLCRELDGEGVEIVSHPLAAIERAALIAEQRCTHWNTANAA
ncbi:MAG: hypothetical protein M3Y18_08265 [Candidatus Eremiobacteraeota bacterium]|nr:hypothetical protein [Candidatus Eremiobacteraeota bacterium]